MDEAHAIARLKRGDFEGLALLVEKYQLQALQKLSPEQRAAVVMKVSAYPETMTENQTLDFVGRRMFVQRWEGPWQFTVTVR